MDPCGSGRVGTGRNRSLTEESETSSQFILMMKVIVMSIVEGENRFKFLNKFISFDDPTTRFERTNTESLLNSDNFSKSGLHHHR